MTEIAQGCRSFTGQVIKGWTIRLRARAPIRCSTLAQAKKEAAELGFPGPWKREIRKTGVRGKPVVYYVHQDKDNLP